MRNYLYTDEFIKKIRIENDEYYEDLDVILSNLSKAYKKGNELDEGDEEYEENINSNINLSETNLQNWFYEYTTRFAGSYTRLKNLWEEYEEA